MNVGVRKKKPWEEREISYSEWGRMDYDWANEYKVCYNVESYFFRYDNYMKYKETGNEHIKKSTFGVKHDFDIQKEIDKWFDACIGAYCEIDIPLC